jgi:arginine N-succinyltransferase
MLVVRPAVATDVAALAALVPESTQRVPALPETPQALRREVEHSLVSFAANSGAAGAESYLFVLEDDTDGVIAGAAAMSVTAGSNGIFFAFRNDVIQQVSPDLNISHSVHALTLCSDLSGYSWLGGSRVGSRGKAGDAAVLLSRARLLFSAIAPHRFRERFFTSLAGITDADGRSPFWEALGRKFFPMDFLEAERVVAGARNRMVIVELMPHYPVYVPLLPDAAQAAMGQVHGADELPLRILRDEGFEPGQFIDIFDGGPILLAQRHALRSSSASMRCEVGPARPQDGSAQTSAYLVGKCHEQNFRAVVVALAAAEVSDRVSLTPEAMRGLDVVSGDVVLCVKLWDPHASCPQR